MTDTQNFPVATQLTIPAALERAYAHWNAGQAGQAELFCRRVLEVQPFQADALHLLGVMAHAYGKLDMAIGYLRQACVLPQAPAVYLSNLAEMCRQGGLLAEGEQAAQRAVTLDPALIAAWTNLGIILQESGKLTASLECLERVVALNPDVPESHNNLANTYQRLGRSTLAKQHYEKALTLNPGYAEAHSNLAFSLAAEGKFELAAAAARQAIDLNPQCADAYLNLAEAESARLRYGEALHWLQALLSFAPQHIGGLISRATVFKQLERIDDALASVHEAVALAPEHANAHNVLGQVLQALNRHDEALAAFDRAAALPGTVAEEALIARAILFTESGRPQEAIAAFDQASLAFPDSVRVMASRADAKTFKAGDPDIDSMEQALAAGEDLACKDTLAFHFALGKAYFDTGDSARAFHHLNSGNRLKRTSFSYDGKQTAQWMERIKAAFPETLLTKHADSGAPSPLPVFIIGMPRSGTTLLEQILASHPQVHGAGELGALRVAVEKAGAYPELIGNCRTDDLRRIGQDYLARIEALAQGKDRLVDKMPANFLYAGLIPLILPGARIIHSRRDPIDTCLSCYSKLFAGEQMFAYDLAELGQFHRGYQSLMAHWREVLPATSFIEIDYEAMLDDLEREARRMIDFIGLPWDEACLSFHKTKRVVRTASVNQVRQPIYKTSQGRWRAHAAHLGPLLAALGVDAGIDA